MNTACMQRNNGPSTKVSAPGIVVHDMSNPSWNTLLDKVGKRI